MKRIFFAACGVALLAAVPMTAQTPNYDFGGVVFNHDLMISGDFANLSRVQDFGTARSMAMGGAFVSLGADMASMSLNPAGLGMYRHNEFSITPVVNISKASTPGSLPSLLNGSSNSKARFALANVGVAFNVFESTHGALTSLTLGVGMNRIADFNSNLSFGSENNYSPGGGMVFSIADVYADQLQKGVNDRGGWRPIQPLPNKDDPSNPNGPLNINDYGPYFWPAILGYKTMMNETWDNQWMRGLIGNNASIRRSFKQVNTGSINEFNVAAGMNFNNVIYVGATLGIQSVYKRTETTYREDYYYDNTNGVATDGDGNPLNSKMSSADLWQRVKLNGSGVNFKIGVIARPIPALRLGVAFHTPTFYSLERTYDAEAESIVSKNIPNAASDVLHENAPGVLDNGGDSWEFVSPSRLMFGASYTFGQFAILSVDYERDWYNGIRIKNVPNGADFGPGYYKSEFKHNFCGTNIVRAGLEVKPLPMLAIRAGGGYSSSMLKDASLIYDIPLNTESYYFTAGLGFNFSRSFSLDLAYQNYTDKQSEYYLFYGMDNNTGELVNATDLYKTKYKRHMIAMTLAFRF